MTWDLGLLTFSPQGELVPSAGDPQVGGSWFASCGWELELVIGSHSFFLVGSPGGVSGLQRGRVWRDPRRSIPRGPPAIPTECRDQLFPPHRTSEGRRWGRGRVRSAWPVLPAVRSRRPGTSAPCPSAVPGMTVMTHIFLLNCSCSCLSPSACLFSKLTDSLCLPFESVNQPCAAESGRVFTP